MVKKSFVLYTDQKEVIDELDDEQAGKLFKAIYEYNTVGKISLTGVLKSVFASFKITFDRDEEKWKDIKQKRSEAGKKGMESRWKKEDNKITNDNKRYQTLTNITDSVSVSASVSDSVCVINNPHKEIPHTHDTVFQFCLSVFSDFKPSDLKKSCKKFFNYYEEKQWKGVKKWQDKLKLWIEDDIENGKIGKLEKYDTRRINEDENGRLFQYDEEGGKIYVDG